MTPSLTPPSSPPRLLPGSTRLSPAAELCGEGGRPGADGGAGPRGVRRGGQDEARPQRAHHGRQGGFLLQVPPPPVGRSADQGQPRNRITRSAFCAEQPTAPRPSAFTVQHKTKTNAIQSLSVSALLYPAALQSTAPCSPQDHPIPTMI